MNSSIFSSRLLCFFIRFFGLSRFASESAKECADSCADRRRGHEGIAGAILAALFAIGVIATVELRYRGANGGPIGVVPGQTGEEFQWKMKSTEGEKNVIVVGDSRVGWGFSEQNFTEGLRRLGVQEWQGVNAGLPATGAGSILSYIERNCAPPGVVVINYSPACLYFFDAPLDLTPAGNLKLQDVLDNEIEQRLRGLVYTKYLSVDGVSQLVRNWDDIRYPNEEAFYRRIRYPEGFMNATIQNTDGTPLNLREYQLRNYEGFYRGLNGKPGQYETRLRTFLRAVKAVRERGFEVFMVRLPIGARMKEVEKLVPENYGIAAVAQAANIEYIDYSLREDTAQMDTIDESHLTPECARHMGGILARDLNDRCL